MTQQVPLDPEAVAAEEQADGTLDAAPDIAYLRLLFVNVVFYGTPGQPGWVLVDAGVTGGTGRIRAAAERRFGKAPPAAIVLTHGHFDHVGNIQELAEGWDVPVYAHALERPYLDGSNSYPPPDPTVGGGAMALLSPLYPRRPIDLGERLRTLPEDGSVPGMEGWRWLHTPGHSVGHVSLWRSSDRALISGDAVITTAGESAYASATQAPELHGPPKYFTHDWEAAETSAAKLAALHPALLVPGHGRALQGGTMDAALQRLALDFRRIAVPEHGRFVDAPRRAEDGTAYDAP